MQQNYYRILGLDYNASDVDIKRSFRVLSLKYHPDISSHENAHYRFIQINEAYQILSNPQKKARYDFLYNYNAFSRKMNDFSTKIHTKYSQTNSHTHVPFWKHKYPVREILLGCMFITLAPPIILYILILIFGVDNMEIESFLNNLGAYY